ncbi:hypothetical protein [Nitrosomonas sp.]|uniref:hypothetical protein n=1 Tax=Nitrosomonas sp. TaxID=42353 RepID=UPI00272730AF|nr:hypothetical protein [Nitrosomonas sp.]MDO8895312.1 hypothetical protein [Nitrosomonas sp.]
MLSFLRKLIFLDKARDKILALINEVLDLARVESEGLYLKQEPVEVCSFIEECISLARTQADKLDIQRIHASSRTKFCMLIMSGSSK